MRDWVLCNFYFRRHFIPSQILLNILIFKIREVMKIRGIPLLTLFLVIMIVVLLVVAYSGRDGLNNFISDKMKEQNSAVDSISVTTFINSKYNYAKNEQNFEFTLLEFGSNGCTVCKQMEPVLEKIRSQENPKVNVAFVNIMYPENLQLMKYFGISAVPMQILLDKQGNEFFRHYGFISVEMINTRLISK